jgi:hypothetical protein
MTIWAGESDAMPSCQQLLANKNLLALWHPTPFLSGPNTFEVSSFMIRFDRRAALILLNTKPQPSEPDKTGVRSMQQQVLSTALS